MHVAFVLSALQAGGAERVINILSSAAISAGWAVTIISFDRPEDPVFHLYHPQVNFIRLAIGPGALHVARRMIALRRTMREGRFDRVISFLAKINVITLAAALGLPQHVTVSERNNPRLQPMNALWRLALRRLYRRADDIVMQTSRSVACLPKRHRARAVVIPNPVELPAVSACRSGSRTVVGVGRLTPQKGFDLLIAAFARAAAENPAWRLVIWGEGPARSALEHQIGQLGFGDRITLPGLSATPGSWVHSAEIFVLSSRYEGFPNAMLEAMAAGLAVTAFDCDFGPAELIEPARAGVLVPHGAVGALARSLSMLMRVPEERRRLGRAARKVAARLSDDRISQLWLSRLETTPKGQAGSL